MHERLCLQSSRAVRIQCQRTLFRAVSRLGDSAFLPDTLCMRRRSPRSRLPTTRNQPSSLAPSVFLGARSRVVLGLRYPSDVLAGAGIASISLVL
jgi:hypothetical protein